MQGYSRYLRCQSSFRDWFQCRINASVSCNFGWHYKEVEPLNVDSLLSVTPRKTTSLLSTVTHSSTWILTCQWEINVHWYDLDFEKTVSKYFKKIQSAGRPIGRPVGHHVESHCPSLSLFYSFFFLPFFSFKMKKRCSNLFKIVLRCDDQQIWDPQVDTELVKFNNYRTVRTHCMYIYYERDHDISRKWKGKGWIAFLPVSFLLSRSYIILISNLHSIPFLWK